MRTGIEREPKKYMCSFIPDQNRLTYWVAVNGLRQFILKFKHWIDQFSARTRTKYSDFLYTVYDIHAIPNKTVTPVHKLYHHFTQYPPEWFETSNLLIHQS